MSSQTQAADPLAGEGSTLMQVFCLGTTGYHPSPNRHTACYYIPDLDLVLDAGTGLFRLIPLLLKQPKRHLHLLLSHAHLDHIVGLTFLLDVFAVTELTSVTVHGDAEKLTAIREHLYSEPIFPVTPSFAFQPWGATTGTLTLGSASVRYFPLIHPGGSTGFVISAEQKRLAYVTDTVADVTAGYVDELRELDLLMHECYFDDGHKELAIKTGHSWLSGVFDLVQTVNPRQTYLIHINPLAEILNVGLELTEEHRKRSIRIAEDEQVIEI